MTEGTNSSAAYDILLKILLIGDPDTKKSELLHRYVEKPIPSMSTIGEEERKRERVGEERRYISDV